MKRLVAVLMMAISFNAFSQDLKNAVYKNPKNTSQQRALDLLSRMTLIEKQQQLMSYGDWERHFDSAFFADPAKVESVLKNGIGIVGPRQNSIDEMIFTRNHIQKYLLTKTRLGIPAIFIDEALHGMMKANSTVFPQAIGLSCSWDTSLFQKVFTIVAKEVRMRGGNYVYSPVVDICRDPRWGRVEETYGEDPFLCSALGTWAVRGLQGNKCGGAIDKNHVAATLKHFSGHGQPDSGLNTNPALLSVRYLRSSHFYSFQNIIANAKPAGVMASYNEIDGVPSHANKWLLTDVLRNEFGFTGIVISDAGGIDDLVGQHHIARDQKDAARLAFNAGVNLEITNGNCYQHLAELVNENKIKLVDIDSAVFKVLKLKFDLGLFEYEYSEPKKAYELSKSEESKRLALEAALKSIVLLKNKNNILPLDKNKYKNIAIIGPCSKAVNLGGYSGDPLHKVSIWEGMKKEAGDKINLLWAQGCKLTSNYNDNSFVNWTNPEITFPTREENLKLISEAVEIAKKAELILLCVGENEQLCRESIGPGDASTLDLMSQQNELFDELKKLNKPIVVYLMHGRPLSVNSIEKEADAIIDGWYMGQETGNAAALTIFGKSNPSGKLTITVPKSVGQLPMYYSQKDGVNRKTYVALDHKPLFPFGFGLSYSNFEYSNLTLSNDTIRKNETLRVTVDIKNTSKVEGEEIAELYIREELASVTQPLMQLRDFSKVLIKPGESKTVTFNLNPSKFAIWDISMKYSVESGSFKIMVGKSSVDFITKKVYIID